MGTTGRTPRIVVGVIVAAALGFAAYRWMWPPRSAREAPQPEQWVVRGEVGVEKTNQGWKVTVDNGLPYEDALRLYGSTVPIEEHELGLALRLTFEERQGRGGDRVDAEHLLLLSADGNGHRFDPVRWTTVGFWMKRVVTETAVFVVPRREEEYRLRIHNRSVGDPVEFELSVTLE